MIPVYTKELPHILLYNSLPSLFCQIVYNIANVLSIWLFLYSDPNLNIYL